MWRAGSFLLVLLAALRGSAQQADLNVVLMQSTFMLEGNSATPGMIWRGTGFVLVRPNPGTAPDATSIGGRAVLVTANHVLKDMVGTTATIYLRTHEAATDRWVERRARFRIRSGNGEPLWKKHPEADIAVMYVRLPFQPEMVISTALLATDDLLKGNRMAPGVELNCLGYPLGFEGPEGFPILRTGVIASYPLVPTKTTKNFLFDFRVFAGNSGGPVYFKQQEMRGSATMCCGAQFIMGLVTDEEIVTTPEGQQETYKGVKVQQLSIGWVVHASLIADAIAMLPSPESADAVNLTAPIEFETQR